MAGSVDWYRKASALAHQLEDERLIFFSDSQLGYVTPDYAQATTLLNQVIQWASQTGWKYVQGPATHLGQRMGMHGDYEQAAQLLEQCVASIRATGDKGRLAYPLWRLGQVHLGRADYARARAALDESIALDRAEGSIPVRQLVDLGTIGLYTGDDAPAREALGVTFPFHLQADNLERVAQGLVLAAGLAHMLGKLDQAVRLLGAAAAIRRDHHTHGVFERGLFAEYDRRLPAVRAALDPADFDKAWAEGQKLTIKEAIAEALAI
jgi:tetratricopeptide (TPR) repeat protein